MHMLIFCTKDWTYGLTYAKQALSHQTTFQACIYVFVGSWFYFEIGSTRSF